MQASRVKINNNFQLILLVIIICNLIILDILVVKKWFTDQSRNVLGQSDSTSCPQSCLSYIDRRTGGATTSAKEYYIPLGAGAVAAKDWVDVVGAESTIDSRGYGQIKSVVFEVTVSVPTGNQLVWVRLYNATDKHPVWFSELSMSGSGPTILTSPALALDSNTKRYVVQMKSQLGANAQLLQSRLKILSK
jgi:hypothetical protein